MNPTATMAPDGYDAEPTGLAETLRARAVAERHIAVFRALVEHLADTVRAGDSDRAREIFREAEREWRLAEQAMATWIEAMRRQARGA